MPRAQCKNILFWISVCAVALLVMVQPVYADTVNAENLWISDFDNSGAWKSTAASACQAGITARNASLGSNYAYCGIGASVNVSGGVDVPCIGGENMACSVTGQVALAHQRGRCPTGYTKSGTYPNEICTSVVCPTAGTLYANGYFNIGTVPTGRMLNTACVSSCKIELISGASPAATAVIGGTKYYYGQGKYNHTGQNCSPDTSNFLADFVGSLPSQTCAAGQQMITMSGVTKCFSSDGTTANLNSASAVSAAQTLTDAKKAAQITAAQQAAQSAGLSASAVESAQAVAAGVAAAGGTGGGSTNPDPVMAQYCADNPTAPICAQEDFGTVEDVSLTDRTINVAITPVSVGGAGSCPAPSPMTIHGQTRYFEWTTYCNFSTSIKPIILAFAWLSAAGLLVGGFRSA